MLFAGPALPGLPVSAATPTATITATLAFAVFPKTPLAAVVATAAATAPSATTLPTATTLTAVLLAALLLPLALGQ
jgi:hypothetical protein